MKIAFRLSTVADLKWFRRYYTAVFPEGEQRAKENYLQAYRALLSHPLIGHPVEGIPPMRELVIPRTPFSFIYFIETDAIIVTRVLDSRAERPDQLG